MKIAHKNSATIAIGAMVFVWYLLRIWQGLDFADMGYWLTGYQQFYSYPQGIGDGIVNWLTFCIGHWAGVVFGGGVFSYKFGYVLVMSATAVLAYRIIADATGHGMAPLALVLIGAMYIGKSSGNWVGYNNLTSLFYLTGLFTLFYGLAGENRLLVALAGFVLGANTFVRLPNLLGVSLISSIWLYASACRWSGRKIFSWSLTFVMGNAAGILVICGAIVLHGHWTYYADGLHGMFALAGDTRASHSATGLLEHFIADQALALVSAILMMLLVIVITHLIRRLGRKWFPVAVVSAASLLYLAFSVVNVKNGYSDSSQWMVTGVCYLVLGRAVILEFRKSPALSLLAYQGLLVLVLAPLGSDNGMANSRYGMWLALPLTLIWLWKQVENPLRDPAQNAAVANTVTPSPFSIDGQAKRILVAAMALALFARAVILSWEYTYDDSSQRSSMRYPISHPLLKWTYTTQERARVVDEFLWMMQYYVKPEDELLAYNIMPLVHFLTGTHPWLGTPTPEFISPDRVATLLREKEQHGEKLPVIVRAKGNTVSKYWPNVPLTFDNPGMQNRRQRIFSDFEARHGYIQVWSNEFFEILRPG